MAKKGKKEKSKVKKYQNPVDVMPKPAYTRSEQLQRREAIQKRIEAEQSTRKKRRRMIVGGFFVFMLLVWWGVQAGKASKEYAICKAFIELHQVYPPSMNIIQIDPFDESMRIYYTIRNSHGATMASMVECIFRPDKTTGIALDSVMVDLEPFGTPEEIQRFNYSIPAIMEGDPDLSLPPRQGDTIESLKRDNLKY